MSYLTDIIVKRYLGHESLILMFFFVKLCESLSGTGAESSIFDLEGQFFTIT